MAYFMQVGAAHSMTAYVKLKGCEGSQTEGVGLNHGMYTWYKYITSMRDPVVWLA